MLQKHLSLQLQIISRVFVLHYVHILGKVLKLNLQKRNSILPKTRNVSFLLEKRFPQQQDICTNGPSLPTIRPALVANIIPILLIINVHLPKYPYIIKPDKIVLISGIPKRINFLYIQFHHVSRYLIHWHKERNQRQEQQ